MKEFDKIDTPETDKQEVQTPVPFERKLIARKVLHRGMKLWKVEMATGKVELAPIKTSVVEVGGKVHHEVLYDRDHYYCEALNKKNAFRKFVRRGIALAQMNKRGKLEKK